jgi:hypothetical protein
MGNADMAEEVADSYMSLFLYWHCTPNQHGTKMAAMLQQHCMTNHLKIRASVT